MKKTVLLLIVLLTACFAFAQEKKMVSVPEDQLTEQQKLALKIQAVDSTVEKAHGWVGIGKEIGQAVDGALASINQRSNEFAETRVGKFTMFLVAWKVLGEQAAAVANATVHFVYGFVEVLIFLPIILWSYRRNCLFRSMLLTKEGPFWNRKKTFQIIDPKGTKDSQGRYVGNGEDEYEVKVWMHLVLFVLFAIVFLVTVFSY
jgi:hypothetical protein